MGRFALGRATWAAGLAAAAIGLALGALFLQPLQAAACAALAATMGAIAAEDLRRFRVPDVLNLLAGAAGIAFLWLAALGEGRDPWRDLLAAFVGFVLCGGALWLVREVFYRMRGIDGLGFGDVKLAAVGGLWIGPERFAYAVLAATIGALGFVAVRRHIEGAWARERRIPLALYLAPSIWACWFLAQLQAA